MQHDGPRREHRLAGSKVGGWVGGGERPPFPPEPAYQAAHCRRGVEANILAWITKLEITFQLAGDSLIKDPLAGSAPQCTSIPPLSANFHHWAAGRCMDSCGNLFPAPVGPNRNL